MSDDLRHDLDDCDEDIARAYLASASSQLKKMGDAVRTKSLPDIQNLAHRLSGSSAFLGVTEMTKLLCELEQLAEQEKPQEISRTLSLLKDEFTLVQRHVLSFLKNKKTQKLLRESNAKIKSNVMIVDDHPLLREGLSRMINQESDLMVCGEAATAHQALKTIPVLKPDIVILDLTLASSSGMDLIKDMKRRSLKSHVLVLSMHNELLYAERALLAGAKGYIMKQEASKDVLKAIRRILEGEIYLSDAMSSKMLHKVADGRRDEKTLPEGSLSDRELQVFQLIGQGRGTRQIAEELHISAKTVESYRAHIKVKMNLKNAHELTQHAVHWVESNHLN